MGNSNLITELKAIISTKIHQKKCKAFPGSCLDTSKEDMEKWKILDTEKIAEECMAEILEMLELWAYIPCCHTTGMHDPEHFSKQQYICRDQKAEAFERFCKDLGINPVTRSKPGCGWCRDYPHYRKGEGMRLFPVEVKDEK